MGFRHTNGHLQFPQFIPSPPLVVPLPLLIPPARCALNDIILFLVHQSMVTVSR